MDDSVGGVEWQPVQEIVRLNFKALHDVVKAHGEALKSVEKAVGSKVNRQEHQALLAEKVSASELSNTFEELSRVIDDKADARDMNALVQRMAGRAEVQAALASKADVTEVQRCLDAKAGVAEVQQKSAQLESRLASMEERFVETLSTKVDMAFVDKGLESRAMPHEVREMIADAVNALREELRKEFTEALEAKASKASVAAALQKKTARSDVETLLAAHAEQVNTSLAAKADVEAVSLALAAKAPRTEMLALLNEKLGEARTALESAIRVAAETTAQQLSSSQSETNRQLHGLKDDVAKAYEALSATSTRLERELARQAQETSAALAGKASAAELQQRARTSAVDTMLSLKPDRSELDASVAALSSRLSSDLSRAAAELRALVDERLATAQMHTHALSESIASKAERAHVEAALTAKCDTREVELWLQSKASLEEVTAQIEMRERETILALDSKAAGADLRATEQRVDAKLTSLAERQAVQLREATASLAHVSDVQSVVEQLVSKSSIEGALLALDKKANVDDINRSLMEVNRELAQRPTLSELNRVIGEQSLIMESLCSEHLLGRWIWKSGKAKGEKNTVPWNVQNINTNPENFLWEKDRCAITTVAPGLYEVTFGYYTRKKPSVQLLVNGEPVLSAVNSASYAVHHSSGRLAAVGPHPAGNVTGLTLSDYLALPPKARISCSYQGEEGGEGFLGLRKL